MEDKFAHNALQLSIYGKKIDCHRKIELCSKKWRLSRPVYRKINSKIHMYSLFRRVVFTSQCVLVYTDGRSPSEVGTVLMPYWEGIVNNLELQTYTFPERLTAASQRQTSLKKVNLYKIRQRCQPFKQFLKLSVKVNEYSLKSTLLPVPLIS